MQPNELVLMISAIVALGVAAQWLAWRFGLPSILLLLLVGFVVGPITNVVPAEMLSGTWVFPFVSMAVGVILFEGGLSLRVHELRAVGRAVSNLITLGVAVTFALGTIAAHYLADFGWNVSLVIGALLTVTGPTVVLPLLRLVRPTGRVGTIAKWEGITVDPVGAVLAVLVLEAVLLVNEPAAEGAARAGGLAAVVPHLLEGLLRTAVVGVGVAVGAAGLLIVLLRRRLVAEWLENPLVLATVLTAFAVANWLQHESGLLVTTLMGIFLANQRSVPVRRIVEFKEDLRVLLLSLLFIVLSARIDRSVLSYMVSPGPLLFLGALVLVVRPIAVALSSIGTGLNWREQTFLAWMAPRGVVAAAVASLFSFRLQSIYPDEAAALAPVVFLVIVGTVAIYGLTITPLARILGLAQADPQGVVFVGAHAWARKLAAAVQAQKLQVLLLDTNPQNVAAARAQALPARRANVLSEGVADAIDLGSIGSLLAMTPNDEVNALAALNFSETLGRAAVYQLRARAIPGGASSEGIPAHLRGRPLFHSGATFPALDARFAAGAGVVAVTVGDGENWDDASADLEEPLPLLLVRSGRLHVLTGSREDATPQAGDVVLALVGGVPASTGPASSAAVLAPAPAA